MADPVSLGLTALTAGGKIFGGIAANRAGKRNARVLREQAGEELRAGAAQVSASRDAARMVIGEQLAAQFGNGFQGVSGSALDSLAQSQVNAALDAMEIRRQSVARARNLTDQAKAERAEGKNALIGSFFDAGASVLGAKADWANANAGKVKPRPRGNI